MFIKNYKDITFNDVITMLGNKLFFVSCPMVNVDNHHKLNNKLSLIQQFIILHLKPNMEYITYHFRNNEDGLGNVIEFVLENCVDFVYIIHQPLGLNFPGMYKRTILFNSKDDFISVKLKFKIKKEIIAISSCEIE